LAEPLGPGRDSRSGVDEGEDSVSLPAFLTDPLGAIGRRWIWMLAAVALGFVATGVATYMMRPTYLAQATILITRQQIPEEYVRSTVREDTISNINAMIGEVLSRENLSRLIETLGMASEDTSAATVSDLVSDFRGRIDVSPGQRASRGRRGESSIIYGVAFRSEIAQEAATVANAIASLFTEASIERRSGQARSTTAFLVRQLKRDEEELREQTQLAGVFRREHRGELPSELDTNLRRLELLSVRRQSLIEQIASRESRILTIQTMPQSEEKSESAILLESLRRQFATESAVNTDQHPNVIALRKRIARLVEIVDEEQLGDRTQQLVVAERRELRLVESQLSKTRQGISELSARIDGTPAVAEELVAVEQKEQVLRERYLGSLRKVEDSQLAESLESAQQGARISVLDRASTPSSPERPRWMIAFGGGLASVLLALGLGVLFEILDPVVVNVRQLEDLADGRCLGSMPNIA
jgi:uncharacterized protein involved in exopolysaccharide biosynthesis